MNSSRSRAFTLIELLVVIAIIGILSAVVLAGLGAAQAQARNAKRVSDLKQLQSALELYATDNGGSYPSTSNNWWGNCSGFSSRSTTGATGYVPNLAPAYISVLPLDPRQEETNKCYVYKSNGTDYMLLAYTTVEGTVPNSLKRPGFPNEKSYAIYTDGASAW